MRKTLCAEMDLLSFSRFCRVLAFAGLLAAGGCASTGDPMEDSIGFRRERAERERLAPRRAHLAQEQESTEAERIRSVTIQKRISAASDARYAADGELHQARAQRNAAQQRLQAIEAQIPAAEAQGEEDRALIERRNREQAEVDRLTHLIEKILETE